MNIHAVTDDKTFDIAAAAQKLPPDVKRLAAKADIVIAGKKLNVAEVDAKLAGSGMDAMSRLQLKLGLERAGLLD
jgi:hypothetical protein